VKSKAMTAEEIHLNDALEEEGFEVVESDLGEYIVQLRHEPPYHIVFPAMHLTRDEISDLFQKELGSAPTREPEELTMIARRALRKKYIAADVGITGANFAVAETGMVSITENEGNARLTAALPKTMVTLLGIEKVLPKLEDLALFLPMLATAGAGQTLTGYNTMYSGPRQPGECDGPEQWHVVLLDHRRTELLADPALANLKINADLSHWCCVCEHVFSLTDPRCESHSLTDPRCESHSLTDPLCESHSLTHPRCESHSLTDPRCESHSLTDPRCESQQR
jgi:L-lactate dehydrogenase complex protein LldF